MRYEVIGDNATISDHLSLLQRQDRDAYVKSKRRVGKSQMFKAVIIAGHDSVRTKRRQLHLFGDER